MATDNEKDMREANVTTFAFIQQALMAAHGRDHELPGSTMNGYLTRLWEAAGKPAEGIDLEQAIIDLVVAMSQLAAAVFMTATNPDGSELTVDEVLERLAAMQLDLATK